MSVRPSNPPVHSVPSPKRTRPRKLRSARRGPRAHAPSRRGGSQQSTGADRKEGNTPERRRRGKYEWHRQLQGGRARGRDQRAATASATARRAKRAAKAATPSSPTGAGSSDRDAPRARASTCFAMAVALLCACSKRRRGVHTVPLLASSIRRAAPPKFARRCYDVQHKKAQSLGARFNIWYRAKSSKTPLYTAIHSSEAPPQTLPTASRNF